MQYTLNTTSDNQITTSNIHTVQGPQGRDGHDGIPGRDGRDGASGRQGKKGDYGLQGPTGPQCMHFKFDLHSIVIIMSTDINNDYSVWTLILPNCETGNQVTHTHTYTHTYTHTHTGPPGPSGLYKEKTTCPSTSELLLGKCYIIM